MNILARFLHHLKARYYEDQASRIQRNLNDYVLTERTRLAICLHRSAWHLARSKAVAETRGMVHGHRHPGEENGAIRRLLARN